MANQTNIPIFQTNNGALNLVQQNINKVFKNIYNQIVSNQETLNQMTILGEIKFSPLTLVQFQDQAGTNWIEANGQSSVGTLYAQTYKLNTVPNISVSGTNAFIKVN